MENNSPYPVSKHALGIGIAIAIILFLLSIVLYLLDFSTNQAASYIGYIISIAGLLFAMIQYRNKHNGGLIAFSKSFHVGFLTGLFMSVAGVILTYIFVAYIATDLPDMLLEISEQKMYEKNPDLSEEEYAMALKFTSKILSPGGLALMGFIYQIFLTLLVAIIGSIFIKKEAK